MSSDLTQTMDLRELIAGNVDLPVEDPQLVKARIIDEILSAPDAEAVFNVGGSTAATDLKNVPLVLRDVRFMKSEIADALPVYALLDCAYVEGGDLVAVNTGSARIMAQAHRAKELDLLPRKVQIVEVAKARPGESAPLGLAAL